MRSFRLLASAMVSLTLAATVLVATPATAGAAGTPAAGVSAAVVQGVTSAPSARTAAPQRAKKKAAFSPTPGLRLNNPRGDKAQRRVIINYLLAAINNTPRGQTIKIKSWSFRSPAAATALIRAHQRGAGVQLIIDRGTTKPSNPDFARVKAALAKGNAARPANLRSFAATCLSSCRGRYGIAHDKFYLFSKVGKANNITMYGSANLTDLAASIQWNDLQTIINDPAVYQTAARVFKEDKADKKVADPVASVRSTTAPIILSWLPWYGPKAVGDPIGNIFNSISCKAPAGFGQNGRTLIRVSQTAILDNRGIGLAKRLHNLRDQGCDVKVIYAIAGGDVMKQLRATRGRGPVPVRQLAVDRNRDGLYDRYLHHKVLTVNGSFEGKGQALAWNGSANWSQSGLASDETFARVNASGIERTYRAFVDKWFVAGPGSRSVPVARAVPANVKNPMSLLQQDR